jgi:hypothetical protein
LVTVVPAVLYGFDQFVGHASWRVPDVPNLVLVTGHVEVLTKGPNMTLSICGIFRLLCPLISKFFPWWLTATTNFAIYIDGMAQKAVTPDKFLPLSWPSSETKILSGMSRSWRGVNLIETLQYCLLPIPVLRISTCNIYPCSDLI